MNVAERLDEVRCRIAEAASRSGRPADAVQLVAVSKTVPASVVAEAYAAGQRDFGENRLQELLGKKTLMPTDCRWHLIGPLQRNKVRKALTAGLRLIHAVERMEIATAISRIAAEISSEPVQVLLEVNIDGEASKHGFSASELKGMWEKLVQLPMLDIQGLMCIPSPVEKAEFARPAFAALRTLAEDLRQRGPLSLPVLSMGMSSDFEVAIEEGATHVRVGSLIFGARSYPQTN